MITIFKSCIVALALSLSAFAIACNCGDSKVKGEVSVDSSTIKTAIKDSPASVVAFHSNSCGTCKVQKPRLQTLMLKKQNLKITDLFLDFDSEKELRKELNVNYPSTVVVFKNGKEVGRVTGETDETKLQELLDKGLL